MSTIRSFFFALLGAAWLLPAAAQAQQAPVPVRQSGVIAAPLVAAPKLDGVLDDAAWQKSQPLRRFAFRKKAVAVQTEAWICRDARNLYFAARCFDDQLDQLVTSFEGSAMWKNDCLEIFIVPEKRELFFTKLLVTCDGRTAGGTWVPDEWGEPTRGPGLDLQAAVGREAKAWTVEIAVPLQPFGMAITPKSVWALGFNREKKTDPAEVSGFLGGFNAPREYPDLVFDGRTILFDGMGVRNVGAAPANVRVTLAAGAKVREVGVPLAPGASWGLDWQKECAGLAEGEELTLTVADAADKTIGRESYLMVAPPPPPSAPLDLTRIPPARFAKTVLDDPSFFPIGVWAQPAGQATAYAAMGVNVFVGGVDAYPRPKDAEFLDSIAKQGMVAICPFKKEYVDGKLYEHPAFLGWMFGDEPDNSVAETGRTRYTPEQLLQMFAGIRTADPAHRVYLNLGCGVANERFVGRAATDEEYDGFCKACDIVSYDVYPCNSVDNGGERLHLVAKGIDRLRAWAGPDRRVWCWIEANKISANANEGRAPTPEEVKTEVWMALVHGANGYGFFCHTWFQKFKVSGIEPEMQQALAVTNAEVKALARVLNSPTVAGGAVAKPSLGGRVDCMMKRAEGATYVFAVNMLRKAEKPAIAVQGLRDGAAEVLNENRTVPVRAGRIVDDFAPYAVHLYRIAE